MGGLSASVLKTQAQLSCRRRFVAEAALLKVKCLLGDLRPLQDREVLCVQLASACPTFTAGYAVRTESLLHCHCNMIIKAVWSVNMIGLSSNQLSTAT